MLPVLPRHQPSLSLRQVRALIQWLKSPQPAAGVPRLETSVARYTGKKGAMAVSSRAGAWRLLFEALGYPPGSKVILPSLHDPLVRRVIQKVGLEIVWAPVQQSDLAPNLKAFARGDLFGVKAFVLPHPFGYPADVERVKRFCSRNGFDLLEDCRHALGGQVGKRPVGSFGRAAVVSFDTDEVVGIGGGGVIATSDGDLLGSLNQRRSSLEPEHPLKTGVRLSNGVLRDLVSYPPVYTFTVAPAAYLAEAVGLRDPFRHRSQATPPARMAPLPAFLTAEALEGLPGRLAKLQGRWSEVYRVLHTYGMELVPQANTTPVGARCVGIAADGDLVAGASFSWGIDVRLCDLEDAVTTGIGHGAERCEPIREHYFQLRSDVTPLDDLAKILKHFG